MVNVPTPVSGQGGQTLSYSDLIEAKALKQEVMNRNYTTAAKMISRKIGSTDNPLNLNSDTPIINALMDRSFSYTDIAKVLMAFSKIDKNKMIIPLLSSMEDRDVDRMKGVFKKLESLDPHLYDSIFYDLARYDIGSADIKVAVKLAKPTFTPVKAAEIFTSGCKDRDVIVLDTYANALYLLGTDGVNKGKADEILELIGKKDPELKNILEKKIASKRAQ